MMTWIQGNFRVLLVTWVMFGFGFGVYTNYFQLFLRGLGANDIQIGLGFSIFFASSVLGLIFGYALPDAYGRAEVVRKGTFLVSLPPLLYLLAWDFRIVLAIMGLEGFFTFYHPALVSLTQDSMPASHAGKGFAIAQLTIVASLPAPLIGGYFYATRGLTGLRYALLISFIIALSASIYRYFRLKETFLRNNTGGRNLLVTIRGSLSGLSTSFRLLSSTTIFLLLSAVSLNLGARALVTIYPLYLKDFSIVDSGLIGFYITAATVSSSLIAFIIGTIIDRNEKPRVVAGFSFLLIPVSAAILLLTKSASLIFVAAILSIGGLGFYLHDFYKLRLFPVEKRANLNSMFLLSIQISGIAAGALGGILYSTSTEYLFVFSGFAFIVSSVCFLRVLATQPTRIN